MKKIYYVPIKGIKKNGKPIFGERVPITIKSTNWVVRMKLAELIVSKGQG